MGMTLLVLVAFCVLMNEGGRCIRLFWPFLCIALVSSFWFILPHSWYLSSTNETPNLMGESSSSFLSKAIFLLTFSKQDRNGIYKCPFICYYVDIIMCFSLNTLYFETNCLQYIIYWTLCMLIFIFILDIDECNERNITCPGSNKKCYNSIGSYFCGCEPGYTEFEDYCSRKCMQHSIYFYTSWKVLWFICWLVDVK